MQTKLMITIETKLNIHRQMCKDYYTHDNPNSSWSEFIREYIVNDMFKQLDEHDDNNINISAIVDILKLNIRRQAIIAAESASIAGFFSSYKLTFIYDLATNVVTLKRTMLNLNGKGIGSQSGLDIDLKEES